MNCLIWSFFELESAFKKFDLLESFFKVKRESLFVSLIISMLFTFWVLSVSSGNSFILFYIFKKSFFCFLVYICLFFLIHWMCFKLTIIYSSNGDLICFCFGLFFASWGFGLLVFCVFVLIMMDDMFWFTYGFVEIFLGWDCSNIIGIYPYLC